MYSQLKHKHRMQDIANKEVRPDVYVPVHKMIDPVAMGRFREPRPEEAPEERVWDDGPKPKEEPTPPFKFKMPEVPDEEDLKAKARERAEEGHKKYQEQLKKDAKDEEEGDDEYGPKIKKDESKEKAEKFEKAEAKEDEDEKKKEAAKDKADKKEADEADKEEKESAENKKTKEGEAKKD